MQGPHLIFDKSSLESLNLDEAVMLDNFYTSNVIPIFFVECLADLEKQIVRSKSTPEQLVGSLATRTPDMQATANIHHMTILKAELSGRFDLRTVLHRPYVISGAPVQLGASKGMIFRMPTEEEALHPWTTRDFLDVERNMAKAWRRALSAIDFEAMVTNVMKELGHWRKPKSLNDAKAITDLIIDNMDPEWLLNFGLQLLGVPETTDHVIAAWRSQRKPPLRDHLPYFVFMLSINIFFCLVLPSKLLRDVKQSHQIDLAYLYYLPFCSVFTSKDNFHVQIVPLFLHPSQTFVNGADLKEDLRRLNEHFSKLPMEELDKGLYSFAQVPPDDETYLTTRLWNKYQPYWRTKDRNKVDLDPELQKVLVGMVNRVKDESQHRPNSDDVDVSKLDYVTMSRQVWTKKGKYLRFSKEIILKNQEEERQKAQQSSMPPIE